MWRAACWVISAALTLPVAARAALPEAGPFAEGVESGRIDLERFDFAVAGFWTEAPEQKWPWYAGVSERLQIRDPTLPDRCDPGAQRRAAAAIWLALLPLSPSAEEWRAASAALQGGLARLDAAMDAAAFDAARPYAAQPLLAELQRRFARDQFIRRPGVAAPPAEISAAAKLLWGPASHTRATAVDCDNTRWLKQQLERIRWFDIPAHGAPADEAAWHLVQHADRDPDFQRRMLATLQALPKQSTSQKRVAYLWDRVAGKDGRPQRFATQGTCQPDGRWQPLPTEDPEHLDERRVALGMPPLAEHAAAMAREACGTPAAK